MTFQVAGTWLAVPVEQMDRIAFAERLWPVPLARPEHAGLMDDDGELIPVLRRGQGPAPAEPLLVAVLHVRDESAGVAVDAAGRVYDDCRALPDTTAAPVAVTAVNPRRVESSGNAFWLIDPDRLWPAPEAHTPNV